MVMRYHWGCAVGHIYTQVESSHHPHPHHPSSTNDMLDDQISDVVEHIQFADEIADADSDDQPEELLLDVQDDDTWDDTDDEDMDRGGVNDGGVSEDELVASADEM